LDEVQALPGVSAARAEADRLIVQTNNAQETVLGLQRVAVQHGQPLTDLSIKQPDLEDVFLAMTGRKIRESN
jgi:ABC-2 type transport system ATP-binding protein